MLWIVYTYYITRSFLFNQARITAALAVRMVGHSFGSALWKPPDLQGNHQIFFSTKWTSEQVNKSIQRTWLYGEAAAMHVYDGQSGFFVNCDHRHALSSDFTLWNYTSETTSHKTSFNPHSHILKLCSHFESDSSFLRTLSRKWCWKLASVRFLRVITMNMDVNLMTN